MSPLRPEDISSRAFNTVRLRAGYEQSEVDEFLDECEVELRARVARLTQHDSGGRLAVRLTGTGVDTKRFTAVRLRQGYDQQQVDEFLGMVRDQLVELDRDLTRRGVTVERRPA